MMRSLFVKIGIVCSLMCAAQKNNPAPCCVANYMQGCAERFIANVSTSGASGNLANATNGCGPFADGYSYYCNHYIATTAGQTFTCSVTIGGFNMYDMRVYFDWSGDNTFAVPSEVFYSVTSSMSNSAHVFTVTVPATQPNGVYRLRVKMVQWGLISNMCTTEWRGETEDYDVYVGIAPPVPSAPVTLTATSNGPLCPGQSLFLNVNYTSSLTPTFSWIGPASFTSSLQNPTLTPVTALGQGYYSVSAFTGTCPVSTKVFVSVNPATAFTVTPSSACAGNQQTLSASGAASYTWSTNSNASIIIVNPIVSTVYTVTAADAQPCPSTKTVMAMVHPLPQLTVSASPTICAGAQATLSAAGAGTYTWDTSSNSPSIVVSPSATTIYTVSASNGTCVATSTVMQSVSPCTGIADTEMADVNEVKAYPNPFKDELIINSNKTTLVTVIDLLGNKILQKEVQGQAKLNTSQLPKGVYFIRFGASNTIKLIKD